MEDMARHGELLINMVSLVTLIIEVLDFFVNLFFVLRWSFFFFPSLPSYTEEAPLLRSDSLRSCGFTTTSVCWRRWLLCWSVILQLECMLAKDALRNCYIWVCLASYLGYYTINSLQETDKWRVSMINENLD